MKIKIPTHLQVALTTLCLGAAKPLFALDLESEAEKAKGSFMKILTLGLGVMSAVVMVSGLVLAAVKFAKKDENALWYLIGTVGASVLLGAAAAYAN